MTITVTRDDLETTGRSEGSVVVLTGTDENGRRVTFAGDGRPMGHLIQGILIEGEATAADVEGWQILGVLGGAR